MSQEQVIVGIDPGSEGALAVIAIESGKVLEMVRIPYYTIRIGTMNRTRIDCNGLKSMISDWQCAHEIIGVVSEHLGPVGPFNSHTNFGFGAAMAAIEMLCACFQLPLETVNSKEWQHFIFPGKGVHDKERSRMKVRQEYPYLQDQLKFKNTNDLAEAVLIAEYGRRKGLFR